MAKSGEKPWSVDFLENDVFFKIWPQGFRVYEVKLQFRGHEVFAVARAVKDAEYLVHFFTGKGLSSISGALNKVLREGSDKWRTDKYPPT